MGETSMAGFYLKMQRAGFDPLDCQKILYSSTPDTIHGPMNTPAVRSASDLDFDAQPALDYIQQTLAIARAVGASAAEVGYGQSAGLSVTVRMGELETLQHQRDKSLQVTVFDGLRKGSASTTDMSNAALHKTVEAAYAIARHGGEDDCAGLVEREQLAREVPDLDLFHPRALDPQQAIVIARECEDAARADKRITNSEGATVRTSAGVSAYGNSNGFAGAWRASAHRMSCAVIANDGSSMQQDYDQSVARRWEDLRAAVDIGRHAGERAVRRLGARKIETTTVPVLFDARIATSLFGHFIAAISGSNLYRRTSFLLDQLGHAVFPEWVQIREEPFLPRELGSRPFDDDGVAPQPRAIVENGVLKSYLLGGYSARKLGLRSTGNASGITNWRLSHGAEDQAALIKRMRRGLLVTELMGFGVNGVTGDYSRGAGGYWVDGGEIQHPVEEITIAGNLKDMFKGIVAIGADVDMNATVRTGSILIDRMTIAGK
jgi:PmbA protein